MEKKIGGWGGRGEKRKKDAQRKGAGLQSPTAREWLALHEDRPSHSSRERGTKVEGGGQEMELLSWEPQSLRDWNSFQNLYLKPRISVERLVVFW